MTFWEKLTSLFKEENKLPTCQWENTGFGLLFSCLSSQEAFKAGECLETYQFLVLQQLLESGNAIKKGHDIHVDSDVLCSLDEASREILGLPEPWPGRFELECRGLTKNSDFTVSLRPVEKWGDQSYSPRALKGPFLEVAGQAYLPDTPQWMALSAVEKHSHLDSTQKTEAANIFTINAIKQGAQLGAPIDLKHFADLDISIPSSISVSVTENKDGSLRLSPYLGDDIPHEKIEMNLGQLEKADKTAALRLGNKIILFDEPRLRAAHEILTNRVIPARDKWQFFKSPSAFLDAALVDLDIGFALRVHGATLFQKAYFGYGERSGQEWFNDVGPRLIRLQNCSSLVKEEEDLKELESLVEDAQKSSSSFVFFKEETIILPEDENELTRLLVGFRESLQTQSETAGSEKTRQNAEEPQQITVDISLHDTDLPGDLTIRQEESRLYRGNLFHADYKYQFYPYQEEGTRWIASLLPTASKPDSYHGGLLADDMGLGKTFMVLAAMNVYLRQTKGKKPILAIMPIVLLENWRQEIERVFHKSPFTDIVMLTASGQLGEFRIEGSRRERLVQNGEDASTIRYSLKIGEQFGNLRLDKPGRLVLTNYDTLRDYQFSLCMVDWGCVVFDEAQEIKNPNTIRSRAARGLKADFRLAVTGTPVENSINDIWTLFDTVKPGLLGCFQDFRREYTIPGDQHGAIETGRRLRLKIGHHMLRRTKEEKLSGLPKKIIHDGMEENSSYADTMSGEQLEAYNAVVSSVVHARQQGDTAKIRSLLLPSLRKLQAISLHPLFGQNGGIPVVSSGATLDTIFGQSAKLRLLIKILNEIKARDEKALIFVINKNLQVFLATVLCHKYGIPVSIINGDTRAIGAQNSRSPDRMSLIKAFEEKSGFNILCLSPLAAGVGLTIIGANNVIHLERHWNPAKEAQATDRVYRIGAPRDVHVYYPILHHPTLKSFDVNLNELLQRKLGIKDVILAPRDIQPDDFNIDSIFGTEIINERVTSELLTSLDWKYFEALCALLAEKEWRGEAYLTSRSGDYGADVILIGPTNIIMQCKTSQNKFAQTNAVREPYAARPSYEKRIGKKFSQIVLAINAPAVDRKVWERGSDLEIEIWDREKIAALLVKHEIYVNDLDLLLDRQIFEL